jgi:hypothetical protein
LPILDLKGFRTASSCSVSIVFNLHYRVLCILRLSVRVACFRYRPVPLDKSAARRVPSQVPAVST